MSTAAATDGRGPEKTVQADAPGDDDATDSGLVTVESNADFETTVSRVEAVLAEQDLSLVTSIDHAARAESVGESLPPTTLFLFGDPAVETPFIQAERSVAIDLPQKLLVWEDEGDVFLTYNDLGGIASRHGFDPESERVTMIDETIDEIVAAIAGAE
jgi:uncharacterized protein (DUF302 family)